MPTVFVTPSRKGKKGKGGRRIRRAGDPLP
jgi:hypothetical protein